LGLKEVLVLFTMDCEAYVSDRRLSERSIRGYVDTIEAYGFPTTLFVHPEVAARHRELLLELQDQGACLGLHLHPKWFGDGRYRKEIGAYSASEQRKMIKEAMDVWRRALGQNPLYFRGGVFSANDNTFRVLQELGFKGGSLSCPGRVLPEFYSVWAGAEPYPHRAHLNFRLVKGDSDFVEVPISVDFQRPGEAHIYPGRAPTQGYEWLYIAERRFYNYEKVLRHLLERFRRDSPNYPTIVTDTHNNEDYSNRENPARLNLESVLRLLESLCEEAGVKPVGSTLSHICNMVLSENGEKSEVRQRP